MCSLYINDTPQTPGFDLAPFVGVYVTDRKEIYVLRKVQRNLTSMELRCERCNI